jgi:diguanylate cyclase (GGDEF)-like protein
MASSDNNKVVQGIVVVLVLAGACAYLLTNGPSGINLAGWLDERTQVINELQSTQDAFRNAEIAQQNYMGTGNDSYLEQFKQSVRSGNEQLFKLRNEHGQGYGDKFRPLEQRLQALSEQLRLSVEARKQQGERSARDLYLTSREYRDRMKLWHDLTDAQQYEISLLETKATKDGDALSYVRYVCFIFIGLMLFGLWFVLQSRQPAIRDAEEKNRVLTAELDAAKTQLDRLANVDFLTEVLNLRGLQQILPVEENRTGRVGGQLVAVLINCDNFRKINESLGHAVGDVVLKELAKRIGGTLRPSDHVARVGGDEFLIVLPDTQLAYAMRVAERIRLAVSESPLRCSNESISVTVSMGVATLPPKITSIEEVLTVTRSALKRSKSAGKNRVSLAREGATPPEAEAGPVTRDIVEVLCDGTHFRTVFQPIIDLGTDKVSGYEMYSRGPDGAFESPADFFRVCVENNVLTTVDLLCLKLCIAATANAGNHLRFHINLFPSTILDTPIDNLLALFPTDRTGKSFCVEISEQQFVGDPGYLRDHVNALKQAGILVAIDDVGFGRSSLESLILLEPDMVKVDRKYVTGVSREPAKARLLKRVVNVAKSLGAEIVAEGIEVQDDLPILKEIGVHYGQGYYWGDLLEVLPTSTSPKAAFQPEKR